MITNIYFVVRFYDGNKGKTLLLHVVNYYI